MRYWHAELLLPCDTRDKVLCSGANYRSHMREMKVNRPDDALPYFFLSRRPPRWLGLARPSSCRPIQARMWTGRPSSRSSSTPRQTRKESEALDYVAGYSGRRSNLSSG